MIKVNDLACLRPVPRTAARKRVLFALATRCCSLVSRTKAMSFPRWLVYLWWGLVREAPGVVGGEEAWMQCQGDGVVELSVFA